MDIAGFIAGVRHKMRDAARHLDYLSYQEAVRSLGSPADLLGMVKPSAKSSLVEPYFSFGFSADEWVSAISGNSTLSHRDREFLDSLERRLGALDLLRLDSVVLTSWLVSFRSFGGDGWGVILERRRVSVALRQVLRSVLDAPVLLSERPLEGILDSGIDFLVAPREVQLAATAISQASRRSIPATWISTSLIHPGPWVWMILDRKGFSLG